MQTTMGPSKVEGGRGSRGGGGARKLPASVAGLLAAALLLAASCGGAGDTPAESGGKGKFKGKGKGDGAVPAVAAQAVLKDVPVEIQVVGNVEPYSTVSVRSQVSGQLTRVLFQDGEYVAKDAPLFSIDPRQIEGQLAQATANLARSKAQLAQAQANLARDSAQEAYARQVAERYGELAKEGIFSKEQGQQSQANADALLQAVAADRAAIESAQAQIAADQATVDNINLQRSYTEITAPIEGRTGNIVQKAGNIVIANNTELAVIQQVQPIYVSFAVPEARLSEVKRYFDQGGKLPVMVQSQDGSGDVENGALTFIDSAVDTNTGTIRLKGTFSNERRNLWPGQFVNVTLRLTTRHNAVVIPNQAVQTGQDGNFVYVVDDGNRVEARPVVLGPRLDLDMVIEDGLQAGETVVTEGQLRLEPGARVQLRGPGDELVSGGEDFAPPPGGPGDGPGGRKGGFDRSQFEPEGSDPDAGALPPQKGRGSGRGSFGSQ